MSETQAEEVEEQYAKIKTNYDEISDITDKFRLYGKDTDGQKTKLVTDGVLHFRDDQMQTRVFDPMKSVWADVRIDFEGIKREGKLVIGSISQFRTYIKRFGQHTIVEQVERDDGMWLQFNDEDRKEGGYPATDEDHIDSTDKVDELPYEYDSETDEFPHAPAKGIEMDTYFVTEVTEIKDIIEDGDTTEVRRFPIYVDEGSVSVKVGDQDGYIETTFQAEGEGEASSVYAYGVDNVFSNLSGEVEVYLTQDGAMWVHQDTEDHTVDYMIAEDLE